MLHKLTHSDPNFELWVDLSEIIMIERYNRPKSTIITMNDDRPEVTAIVLRNGKTYACKETPDEIRALINQGQVLNG
jgi:hypothetical protein